MSQFGRGVSRLRARARRRHTQRVGWAAAAGAALLFACGLQTGGLSTLVSDSGQPSDDATSPESAAPADAADELSVEDGSIVIDASDASDAATVRCGDASVTTCLQCNGATFLCATTASCVASCKGECGAAEVECIACVDAAVAASVCEQLDAAGACALPPREHCGCADGSASACAGPRQVCVMGQCLACGEDASDGRLCKSPSTKHCDHDMTGNPDDELTCH